MRRGPGRLLKGEAKKQMTHLPGRVITLANELIYELSYYGLKWPILVDKRDDYLGKLAVRKRSSFWFRSILDNVLHNGSNTRTWRYISVCLPTHRDQLVVLVQVWVVASRIEVLVRVIGILGDISFITFVG
jgi:hypothetical protein